MSDDPSASSGHRPGALPRADRTRIVRDGLAVGVATGAYGVSFGAVSVAAGLDVLQTCALSLLVFTGASQFALVGVIASGGAPLSGAMTALLLGSRNTLYGLRLAPLLAWRGWRRVTAAHLLIDESTAMAVNRETTAAARVGFLSTGLSVFVLWNLATLAGALAGTALGDPRTYGLDAAVGAAFLALLWPRLHTRLQPLGRPDGGGPRPRAGAGHRGRRPGARGRGRRARRRGADRPSRAVGVMTWLAIGIAVVGCYLLKLAGLSVPARVLENPVVERVADLMPVALLSALVGVQVFGSGGHLVVDARVAGLAFAFVALLLRAPFIVVVFGAALVAGLVRLLSRGSYPSTRRSGGCRPPTERRGRAAVVEAGQLTLTPPRRR